MNRIGRIVIGIACILAGSAHFVCAQKNIPDSLRCEVAFLSAEAMKGRKAGSSEEKRAAKYIYDYLQSLGMVMLSPEDGDDFGMADPVVGDTLYSRNIVGFIPGYDPVLKGEFILLGTQLDGPGFEAVKVNGQTKERVFPGAYSNASGNAVLMQVAKLVAENKFMFRRSVIFGFFGAGNYSQAGSWYFLNRSFADVDKIKFMVDVNSVGKDSGPNTFQAFIGLPNRHILKDIFTVAERPFSLDVKIAEREPIQLDYRSFHSFDIPFTLFTTGPNSLDGTIHDTPEKIDYLQLAQIVEFVYTYAVTLASTDSLAEKEEETSESSKSRVYSQLEVDKRATFLKGDERTFLKDWVYHYIKYPDSAISARIEGTEIAEFVVDAKGKVTDIKITTSLSEDIDREVIKVLKASPKWKPAQINGKNVPVQISVAIEFMLTNRSKFGINK